MPKRNRKAKVSHEVSVPRDISDSEETVDQKDVKSPKVQIINNATNRPITKLGSLHKTYMRHKIVDEDGNIIEGEGYEIYKVCKNIKETSSFIVALNAARKLQTIEAKLLFSKYAEKLLDESALDKELEELTLRVNQIMLVKSRSEKKQEEPCRYV